MLKAFTRVSFLRGVSFMSSTASNSLKPGVASVEQLRAVATSPDVIVIDVRNDNPSQEIESTIKDGSLLAETDNCNRPAALNIVWNRDLGNMNIDKLQKLSKTQPIIVH